MGDFSDMAKRVSKLRDNLEDEHQQATENAMREMRGDVQTTIRANDSVARKKLITDVRVDEGNDQYLTSYNVNVPEWAKYLEHGTGPRGGGTTADNTGSYNAPDPLPPIDPILTWVVAKNLTADEYDSTVALAEAIARTIGAEGTFAHPFLRPVWYSNRGYRNVIEANKDAIERAVRRI